MNQSNETIVIVDDTSENLLLLNGILEPIYKVKAAKSGRVALKIIEMEKPSLILLDIMMPEMDGYQVCKTLKENPETKGIPIIFVTAKGQTDDESYGLSLGAVDYIHKPINASILKARINTHLALKNQEIHLEELVKKRTEALEKTNQKLKVARAVIENSRNEIIQRLGHAAEFKDNETGMHTIRMSHYTRLLTMELNQSEKFTELLFQAAPMHDVGKIGIPDHILLKPGRLTKEEFDVMKTHAQIGADIIEPDQQGVLKYAYTVALTHHEKWNGKGYPNGLKQEEIPLEGRIVAIADVFDALTTERPYKEAWSVERAIQLLEDEKDQHFEGRLVDKFVSILPEILKIKERYAEISN
ncbi:MAG: response regulator [Methylococcales bacterium]|nr:response regulator [Methylococcales bacterium]